MERTFSGVLRVGESYMSRGWKIQFGLQYRHSRNPKSRKMAKRHRTVKTAGSQASLGQNRQLVVWQAAIILTHDQWDGASALSGSNLQQVGGWHLAYDSHPPSAAGQGAVPSGKSMEEMHAFRSFERCLNRHWPLFLVFGCERKPIKPIKPPPGG